MNKIRHEALINAFEFGLGEMNGEEADERIKLNILVTLTTQNVINC